MDNKTMNDLIRAAARPTPENTPDPPPPTARQVPTDAADAAAGTGYANARRPPRGMSSLIRSAAHPERD